ncbi:uncharacterized protein LOC113771952 [Coffea eugenioides]|uniref:Transcription factor MYB97-like n=1 Tax=Coffea arabica TaxID=13443 RepID=A0A6P6XJY0_COFAR|nr:uncharacterized protein LOC113743659 [Coffea arabica]XP_027172298.1 uncharacterized protein LOC113771952 [Coffea eugenioides]
MTQNGVEGCLLGSTSCNLVWWLPEVSSGGPFDGGKSKLKDQPCMLEEGDDLDIQGPLENEGGRAAAGDEGDVMVVKKGPWSAEEDERLKKCVEEHGIGNWITIEKYSGLGRTSKSCRLRWTNHLRPNLKKGSFTKQEERLVVKLHKKYGNKWSYISSKLPGRTDNEIKNFWHGRVRRCRRKFLPIYPEDIEDGGSRGDGLDTDGKNNINDNDHNSSAKNGTNSIPSFPSITLPEFQPPLSLSVPFQQQPSPVINQNPASFFTPLPRTRLLSPQEKPLPSPHGFLSSHYPSPACYPTHIPQSPLSTPSQTQYHSIQRSQSTETPDTTLQNPLLSLPPDCSSIHQSNSPTGPAFTPLKPPPVLSPYVGYLKGSRGSSSLQSSPTAVTQSSAPAQGSSISAKGSSAPSPKIDVSSSVTSSQFSSTATGSLINSPKLHLSVQLPTASSVPLQTSSLPSALSSSNLNSPKIHDPMIASPHSPLRLNLTSSIPLDSHLQHNRCASPFLLSSQSWNASKAEPPSVQTPTSALRPTPEMKDSERSVAVLDAPLQEAQAKTDTLHKNSPEELSVDGYLINNDLQGKILVTESIRDNVFYQSSSERDFSCEKPRTINLLGQSLKQENTTRETPKTEDLINKRSCKKVSHDKCLKPGILMGKISRRQGLLSEISKTGVLLVESEKKQILLQELMNNNLTQDVLARQSSKTVDLQLGRLTKTTKLFGERVSIEDPLSQISARKSSVGQKSEEGVSTFENLTSLRNQNLVEDILDISPTRSTSNRDTFGFSYSPKDTTTQFISDDLQWNLSSGQVVAGEVCNEILRGGAPLASQLQEHQIETFGPVFSHRPELVLSNFGYDGGGKSTCGEFYEGDHLDKSSREKCPDSPKGEFIEDQSQGGQVVSGGFMTEGLLVSQNWHEILRGSISDLDQYITANLLRSPTPDGKLNTPQECGGGIMEDPLSIEGSSSRSLKNGVSLDQSSRDIFLGESSSANVIGLHEVALTEFVSPTRQTTVAHLLTSRDQFSEAGSSQCYEGVKLKQEIEEPHPLPEELSSLLEFSPTTLPDWHDIGCETSSIMDITFGLEMYHLHPIMR